MLRFPKFPQFYLSHRTAFLSAISASVGIAALTIMPAFSPALAQANNDAENLIVEADISLQWKREELKYIATGNATAQKGDALMRADVITAFYETDGDNDGIEASNVTMIEGRRDAKFTQGGFSATATNITYDLIKEMATLQGGNPTVISADEKITASNQITYTRSSRFIEALGNGQITLSNGQTLKGDKIIATLNETEDDVVSATATGNAEVHSNENGKVRQAFADNITYTHETGIAVLTGNVRLVDGGNIMTGDKANVDFISGTSTMSASATGKRVGGVFKPAE